MIYDLNDLLIKMGALEVGEKGRVEWHYFDKEKNELAGFAEIRLEAGGEILCAEMQHLRENYEDEHGQIHPLYTESFFMYAERTEHPKRYRVTRLSLDGEDYSVPSKPVIELGLSVFHARALEISIRMVEQTFNKQDMLETTVTASHHSRRAFPQRRDLPQQKIQSGGVVVPFRPRKSMAGKMARVPL